MTKKKNRNFKNDQGNLEIRVFINTRRGIFENFVQKPRYILILQKKFDFLVSGFIVLKISRLYLYQCA